MTNGASVCPTKMLAAAERLSAPLVPKAYCMIRAKNDTTAWTIPQ